MMKDRVLLRRQHQWPIKESIEKNHGQKKNNNKIAMLQLNKIQALVAERLTVRSCFSFSHILPHSIIA